VTKNSRKKSGQPAEVMKLQQLDPFFENQRKRIFVFVAILEINGGIFKQKSFMLIFAQNAFLRWFLERNRKNTEEKQYKALKMIKIKIFYA